MNDERPPHPGSSSSGPPQKPASPQGSASQQGRCPRCGGTYAFSSVAAHKPFPFCSQRCRDVDLGNWFTGSYAIPGKPLPQTPTEESAADDGT